MGEKVNDILKENQLLKKELERLIALTKENEAKQKGISLIEDSFLLAESIDDIDSTALAYIEEIFGFDKVALFIDSDAVKIKLQPADLLKRVLFTNEQTLKYAYVEKRPYFGTYLEGLISDFRIIDHIGSYLIAPIIENGKIIGSLNMYSYDPERLAGDGQTDFVKQLTLRIAIALRKMHNTELIKNQAKRDFLTGVYNKGTMHGFIERYIMRNKTDAVPFTFMIVDMDNFKELNDRHGHVTGDITLREFANAVKLELKDNEILGRFGGDEFFMLLDRQSAGVRGFFSKLVAIMKELDSKNNMKGVLGISGGYVSTDGQAELPEAEDMVRQADNALYASKAAGKSMLKSPSD